MRLTVVGGYLGSGKTTWLRHQLFERRFGRVQVLVNEAAETPVDDALLGQAEGLRVLSGGCVCCTARSELIAALRDLCDARSARDSRGARDEQIVLETSGLADPAPIVEAIRADPMLVYHIVVSEVVVIVDALHALAQLRSEPLGRKQIETADRLVLTKVDVADPGKLGRLIATLRQLNPAAPISAAVLGSPIDLPAVDPDAMPEPLPDLAGADMAPVFPARLMLGDDIDWTAFAVWLSALLHARGDDVLRVKGVVRTPAGRLLLQAVRRVVQSPEILPEQGPEGGREDGTIVVIGRGYEAADLSTSLRRFTRADG
ncbi:MAG: GTP-binding protein [Pararhodobacter sp.]|nr:GTP-binding protein [Pararhodobacter sp.]